MTPQETGFYLTATVGSTPEVSQRVPIEHQKNDWRQIFLELANRLQTSTDLVAGIALPAFCYIGVRDHAVEFSRKKQITPHWTPQGITLDATEPGNRIYFGIPASGCYKDGQLWTSTLELEGTMPSGEPVKIVLAYEPPGEPGKVE